TGAPSPGTTTSCPSRGGSRGREDLEPTQVRTQTLGHPHRPVRLLVVLEDRDDPARRAEGPVEGGDRAGAAVGRALTRAEPTRLEGRAVRGGGKLEPALLAGQPRLAVELAC